MSDYSTAYTSAVRYGRTQTTDTFLKLLHENADARQPGSTERLVAADAFEEADEPHAAAALRSGDQIDVHANPRVYNADTGEFDLRYQPKRIVNDTEYALHTPSDVIRILENARNSRDRLHLRYGHQTGPQAGRDWLEEHDIEGRVGRSMGRPGLPLLIHSSRAYGGGSILTDSIVRILTAAGKRELWRHPNYHVGHIELKFDDPDGPNRPTHPFKIYVDGKNHANFESHERAVRWLHRLGLSHIADDGILGSRS